MNCLSSNGRAWLVGLWIAVSFLSSTSCSLFGGGGGIKRAKGYHIAPPRNWKKINRAESDVAYRMGSGNIVSVTSSCERHNKAPLEVLTRHLLIGTRDVKVDRQNYIKVSGTRGLRSSVRAKQAGRPFFFEFFVISKKKCIFDFSLVSPKKITTQELGEFIAFIKSFHYGKN